MCCPWAGGAPRACARRGVNPFVYWPVRAVLQPFFHVYFRLARLGREHVPTSGPLILAANHRSFLDPFVIGTIRRPIYFVAKKELFSPLVGLVAQLAGRLPRRPGRLGRRHDRRARGRSSSAATAC